MKCEKCGKEIDDNAKFCCFCGSKVPDKIFCPQCGQKLPAGAVFCSACGKKISETGEEEPSEHGKEETQAENEAGATDAPHAPDGGGLSENGEPSPPKTSVPDFARTDNPNPKEYIESILRKSLMSKAGRFVLRIVIIIAIAAFMGNFNLESSARSAVNDLLEENFNTLTQDMELDPDFQLSKCVRVKIGTKLSNNTYKATAYLENGHEFNITIKKLEDSIQVTMMPIM